MGGSFDDPGSGSKGSNKRPAPTIEATATEVSVETEAEEPKPSDQSAEDSHSAEAHSEDSKTKDADTEDTELEDTGSQDSHSEEDSGSEEDSDLADEGSEDPELEDGEADDAHAAATGGHEDAPHQAPRRSFAGALLTGLVSLFTHAFAGVLGGLAVLLAIAWGYLPMGAMEDALGTRSLKDRIAKLESAPATPDNTASVEALKSRLATLETKTPETTAGAATPAQVAALSDRVAQAEASVKSMADAASEGGSVASAAAIGQQVAEAEKRLDAKIGSAFKSATSGAASDAKAIEGMKSEIAELDAKLKALTEAELGSEEMAQLVPEVVAIDERLGRIEATLPALVNAVDEENAETKKATLAIAYASLGEAVNAGRPYAAELSTLAALSPGAGDLGSLLDYEDKGIPTVRALSASFGTVRDEALAAQAAANSDSLMGRLLGSAQSLVQVRRIDERAKGDSTDAVLARAAAHLQKGDLEPGVMEVETLKGPSAKVFEAWLDESRARLDAQVTLARLRDILLVSLAGSDSTEKADDARQDDRSEQE